jgi:hypothetical protein
VLENPAEKGSAYRKSGLKERLDDIREDEENYGGRPEWDVYNLSNEKRSTFSYAAADSQSKT